MFFKHSKSLDLNHSGQSLLDLLVTLMIGGIIVGGTLASFIDTGRRVRDNRTVIETEETARSIAELMVYELRGAGAGMPLGQDYFAIGDGDLGNVPEPIIVTAGGGYTSSDASKITFRRNVTGKGSFLKVLYAPILMCALCPVPNIVTVADSSQFFIGEYVYLSSKLSGSDYPENGMYAQIEDIVGGVIGQLTLKRSSMVRKTSPAQIFPIGSTIDPVQDIVYDGSNPTLGITRSVSKASFRDTATVVLAPNSSLEIKYYDKTVGPTDEVGAEIALPLTAAKLANDLMTIRFTVTVDSPRPLSNGDTYTAEVTRYVFPRNLRTIRPYGS
ncbi:hypothetical protein JNK13_02315 [bacterium]|nr:hypothetical protein [bacterium]